MRKSSAAGAEPYSSGADTKWQRWNANTLVHLVGDFKQRHEPAAAERRITRSGAIGRPKGSIVLSLEQTYLQPEDLKVTSFKELNCSKIYC